QRARDQGADDIADAIEKNRQAGVRGRLGRRAIGDNLGAGLDERDVDVENIVEGEENDPPFNLKLVSWMFLKPSIPACPAAGFSTNRSIRRSCAI
ncbi:MAG: hypothetical protein WA280_02150, partial [Xanthobacteraceae bacterium]